MLMQRRNLFKMAVGMGATAPLWRSLATGLPMSWILGDRNAAFAAEGPEQFLVVSLSGGGDPLNANTPGTYGVPDVYHNPAPEMAETSIQLGKTTSKAAKPWSTLPAWARDRAVFFHHRTYTNAHPNFFKVLGLFGAAKSKTGSGGEMLPSLFASEVASNLQTVQNEPLVLANIGARLTFQGRVLGAAQPGTLSQVLGGASPGVLKDLETMRQKDLGMIKAELNKNGTPAQKEFLDRHALSLTQLKDVRDRVGPLLAGEGAAWTNDATGQVKAAIAMIQLRLTPVIVVSIPFGGDNHTDPDLANEALATVSGVDTISSLMTGLKDAGLQDKVTFATCNVFGRTLAKTRDGNGRNHNQNHHTTLMIGKGFKGGVIGGLVKMGNDFGAEGFDSATGAPNPAGDVKAIETLESMSKTLGTALGVSASQLDFRIKGGKPVPAALA